MSKKIIDSVKKNLFATKSQYATLVKNNLNKFTVPGESFWGRDLGDNLFLICNDILEFLPNRTCARVGYHNNRKVDINKSVELFKSSHVAYMSHYGVKK